MKHLLPFVLCLSCCLFSRATHAQDASQAGTATSADVASSADRHVVIFEDDFNREESQEETDEPGNGWGTNSERRAGGNKQVDLKDGAMYIYCHADADHGVSVTHPAEFKDGSVETKFMLENEGDSLGLNFADLEFKEVHAGHLFKVAIKQKHIQLTDLKTGTMNGEIHKARKSNTLTDDQKKMLKKKSKRIKHPLEIGKWHTAVATVKGDTLSVSIDGQEIGSLTSPGIGHPTKRLLRLAVPKNAVVDDLKIVSFGPAAVADSPTGN